MAVSQSVVEVAPRAFRFFMFIGRFPRIITAAGLILLLVLTAQVFTIVRDTTVDAFMPQGHPALVYRDKVEEIFGLRDPIVIAVIRDDADGIYTRESFALVQQIGDALAEIENIDPEKIRSLATEKNIVGTQDQLIVERFLDPFPDTDEAVRQVRHHVEQIPIYMGTLVAKDGTGTLISAELLDQRIAGQTYEAVKAAIAGLDVRDHRVLVAGEGAVGGYLSIYLNKDARIMQPVAFVIILMVMMVAFRATRAFAIPLAIIVATAGGAMGIMGAAGIPYYIITAALPVILIGIAVADSIHLLSRYYEEVAMDPSAPQRILVARAMAIMWRPVVLTSLTTIAGFAGISLTSSMPPMFWFGVIASVGVLLALLFSLIFLPAVMCLFRALPSPAFKPDVHGESFDIFARVLGRVGLVSVAHSRVVLGLAALVVVLGVIGATQLKTDRKRIDNFAPSAPIYQADMEINQRFNGTTYLDFVIEAPEADGLLAPERLAKIETLQAYVESLPHVQGTVSIVDYLKQINKAVNANDQTYYRLPGTEGQVAESFLLYESTGGPTDFQEEIDYEYRLALMRAMINESQYSTDREIVIAAQDFIDTAFGDSGLTVNLSGRVNVDYHWMMPLARNHFASVGVSLALVFIMSAILFRSPLAGLMTLAPVTVAVLSVYAVMGIGGIWLEPASSMFAAIAIGLGVDFAIHIIDRMRFLIREQGLSMEAAVRALHLTAGRALFFNFLALFLGFGALMISEMPPIHRLGLIISVAMAANFIAAVIVLPALISVIRPNFCGLGGHTRDEAV